jgi:FkbM family methyltransferase
MKTLACLLILPELKDINHVTRWEENVQWANTIYNQYPYPDTSTIDIEKRWALGYVAWQRLIDYNKNSNIKIYFVRTDYRLERDSYAIENNIITVGFSSSYGHILYKTLIGFKILSDFDFVVRGNINTIIDIFSLYEFIKPIRTTNVFTSPFWEGGDYAFGYFILLSKDIVSYLANVNITDDPRWLSEDTADDYELSRLILKKHIQIMLFDCDVPWTNVSAPKPIITKRNKYGIRFDDMDTSSTILNELKIVPDSVFLYRIRNLQDKQYIPVYKQIIKHIWNKVVKQTYSNLVVYNEAGYKVPHLEYERDEQLLVSHYIRETDVVLELGARYGSVSCIINKILKNKRHQVSVEPDNTVWEALERTKRENKCDFLIYKGIISSKNYDLKLNGYGSTVDITHTISNMETISSTNISLPELQTTTGLKFNVLVADCEGFLETFLNENTFLYDQLDLILFECDRPDVCNYDKIKSNLIANKFTMVENGFQCAFKKLSLTECVLAVS